MSATESYEYLTLTATHTQPVAAGTMVVFYAHAPEGGLAGPGSCTWTLFGPGAGDQMTLARNAPGTLDWDTSGLRPGAYDIRCDFDTKIGGGAKPPHDEELGPDPELTTAGDDSSLVTASLTVFVTAAVAPLSPEGVVPVSLQRTSIAATDDQILWVIVRNRTDATSFRSYRSFVDSVLCAPDKAPGVLASHPRSLLYRGADAFNLLKLATDVFLMHEAGVVDADNVLDVGRASLHPSRALDDIEAGGVDTSEGRRLGRPTVSIEDLRGMRNRYYDALIGENNHDLLPYLKIIRDRLADLPLKPAETVPSGDCYGILRSNVSGPLAIELLWSYWHEEGMLAQTLNVILARFQNRRITGGVDPLARLDLDPLRPLANLFWGYVQDEMHRLTVRRRAFEYEHEYGLQLIGKAVPRGKTVDRRTKFLESFHNLLYAAHVFFKEDDDTTVIADGFPLLNALRETHLLLAEGAHNQFGDLPSAARAEMLVMQWLLGRPEMREFLGGRVMVPYEEDWMDRVDTMKTLQGWTDVTITHFRDLGVYGEQIILTVRYGNWSVANDPQQAANWARYWRPEIQRYVHAYRAATGVDLTERVDATMPAQLLHRRLASQQRRA